MKFFKKDTLTHGVAGGVIGLAGVGAAALLTGGVALVPAAAAVITGTSLGALHGAGDEGGECRKLVKRSAMIGAGALGGAAVAGIGIALVAGGAAAAGGAVATGAAVAAGGTTVAGGATTAIIGSGAGGLVGNTVANALLNAGKDAAV